MCTRGSQNGVSKLASFVIFAGAVEGTKIVAPVAGIPIELLKQLYGIYDRHRRQLPGRWIKTKLLNRETMQITIEIPDDIAQHLSQEIDSLPRRALEALVIDAYCTERTTSAED